jgi:hypothetical protein
MSKIDKQKSTCVGFNTGGFLLKKLNFLIKRWTCAGNSGILDVKN